MEYLAQRLQQLRRQKGFSQENLAELLGVSRQAVGKWESGAAVPELEKLLELCRLFDTDLNDLLGLEVHAGQTEPEQPEDSHQPQGFTEEQMNLLRQLIREGRQAPPSPQPVQKRRRWPWGLVAVAVIVGGISLSEWYGQLQYRLQHLQQQIGNTQQQIGSLQGTIGNIENNIKETLEQQASILTFSGVELTDVSFSPRQFTYALWALPKNRTEHTTVQFSLETNEGTKLLDAVWTGDRYRAEETTDWCEIKTVTVVVVEQGVHTSQVLKDTYLNPAEECLLNVTGWASTHIWSGDHTFSVQGGVYIHQPASCAAQPASVTMWLERDGTQVASIPLKLLSGGTDGFWDYDTEGLIDLELPKQDQTLTLHIRVADSLGCTYTATVSKHILRWTEDGFDSSTEIYDDNPPITVTLPDGSTVVLDGMWKY